MPHVSKRPPSCTSCSIERSLSGDCLRLDAQVSGRGGADTKPPIQCPNDGRHFSDALPTGGLQPKTDRVKERWGRCEKTFDAFKNDQEGVVCCRTSVSAGTLLKRVSGKAGIYESSTGLQSEVGNDGRWSVLFDLQNREIENMLVKWLNAEVRDRLEGMDRILWELRERCALQPCDTGQTQQLMKQSTDCPMESNPFRLQKSEHTSGVCSWSGISSSEVKQSGTCESTQQASNKLATSKISSAVARKRESQSQFLEAAIRLHERDGRFAGTVWRFLEDRFSSVAAYLWSFVIPGIVLMSLIVSIWQTVDGSPLHRSVRQSMQVSIEAMFTVELLLRFLVCPDRRTFCQSPCNVIDLLTCLPLGFRLGVAIASANVEDELSLDIMLPVLRLLKLTRRFETLPLLLNAFLVSLEALPVLLYTFLIIAITFSGLIYAVEPRDNIANLPQAMWFVMVTMTTVGYGDIFPSTVPGQLITSLLMVVSMLYTAMPIGIVGNAFSQAWDVRDRLLLMHRLREAFLQHGFSESAFKDIVEVFADSDHELGPDEFQAMLQTMNININVARVHMLFNGLDKDGNEHVSVDELLEGLFPHDYATYFRRLKVPDIISEASKQTVV